MPEEASILLGTDSMGGRIAILLVLLLCCCSCNSGEVIPLDQIWAERMADTKNVQDLEPEHYGQSQQGLSEEEKIEHLMQSLTYQVRRIIEERTEGNLPGPGFVVSGIGREALINVKQALDTSPPASISADEEVTLFFFSRLSGSYVWLRNVKRSENRIIIHFEFVPHPEKILTSHFALIPLGKLAPGKYDVEIKPLSKATLRENWTLEEAAAYFVSGPFSFSVE